MSDISDHSNNREIEIIQSDVPSTITSAPVCDEFTPEDLSVQNIKSSLDLIVRYMDEERLERRENESKRLAEKEEDESKRLAEKEEDERKRLAEKEEDERKRLAEKEEKERKRLAEKEEKERKRLAEKEEDERKRLAEKEELKL